jgi:hypothetical protein
VVRRCTDAIVGQLHTARELVAVKALTAITDIGVSSSDEAVEMRTLPYEINGLEARRYEIDEGDYLDVELYDGFFTLTWSTDLGFRDVLQQIGALLPKKARTALVFDPDRGKHVEVPPSRVLNGSSKRTPRYPFVRCEFDGFTLVWQQPAYPKHVDEDTTPGQLGIISESFDSSYYTELVRRTATRRLGIQAAGLLEDASFVGKHVRHGRPGAAR